MKRHLAWLGLLTCASWGCNLLVELPEEQEPGASEVPQEIEEPPAPEDELAPERPSPVLGDVEEASPPSAPPALEDDGLVARYFLDEFLGGAAPTAIWDTSSDPQHLFVDPGDGLGFVMADQGRGGLEWKHAGTVGGAWSAGSLVSKTLTRFSGATTLSLELVVDVQSAATNGSDLFSIVTSGQIHVGLVAFPTRYALLWDGGIVGDWPLQHGGRSVLHFVVDTSKTDPAERAVLQVDGELSQSSPALEIPLGDVLDIPAEALVIVGSGASSIDGAMHYLASYDVALPDGRIASHVEALTTNDDRPGL